MQFTVNDHKIDSFLCEKLITTKHRRTDANFWNIL